MTTVLIIDSNTIADNNTAFLIGCCMLLFFINKHDCVFKFKAFLIPNNNPVFGVTHGGPSKSDGFYVITQPLPKGTILSMSQQYVKE
jgi:hypothetical protein